MNDDDLRAEAFRVVRKSYLRTCRGPHPPWGEAMDILAVSPIFLAWAVRQACAHLPGHGDVPHSDIDWSCVAHGEGQLCCADAADVYRVKPELAAYLDGTEKA